MRILHKDPPPAQAKTYYPTQRRHWCPGEPYPQDRKANALEALERNAVAFEHELERLRFTQSRRTDRGRKEAA